MQPRGLMIVVTLTLLIILHPALCSSELTPVFITEIDINSSGGATFGMGRQLVVENENGIFMTYSRDGAHPSTSSPVYWNLLRSTDRGRTFDLIYTPRLMSGIPGLETDQEGNIHLISHDPHASNPPWYYYRFAEERNLTDPVLSITNGVSLAQKYAVFHDADAGKTYLFPNQGTFLILNSTTGRLMEKRIYAGSQGTKAFIQYPHIHVYDGTLYHAWTTQHWKGGNQYVYWDIHFAWSPDGGNTWRKANGNRLNTPFIPDNTGPTDNVVPKEEFEYNTWLNGMTYKDGKVHLAYYSDLPKRHWIHVRIDMSTGEIDRRNAEGETITLRGNGGFLATAPGKPLYMVSTNNTHICALVSHDNGNTWHDAAVSERSWDYCVYVSGHRRVTSHGITGCFTGLDREKGTYGVYFFRIPVTEKTEEPPRPALDLTVKPIGMDILQGESRATCITVASNDPKEEIYLEAGNAPWGLDIELLPSSGSGSFTSIANLTAGPYADTGIHEVPFTATSGTQVAEFYFVINVSSPPPPPDFNISVRPILASIGQGERTHFKVSISPINDFSDYWSLSTSGLPEGCSASLDPSWGKSRGKSNLTVSAGQDTPPGTYPITITGVGAGNRHTFLLQLTVSKGVTEIPLGLHAGIAIATIIWFVIGDRPKP